MPAWLTQDNEVVLKEPNNSKGRMDLPCGHCLGCTLATAKGWALRCSQEQHDHFATSFATLTLDDNNVTPSLDKQHVQLWLKRLRHKLDSGNTLVKRIRQHGPVAAKPIRYFLSGEYGETTERPHYHAILFGVHADTDRPTIQETWGLGFTQLEPINTARICYTAGYVQKKLNNQVPTWVTPHRKVREHVDQDGVVTYSRDTYYTYTDYYGQIREWQPPYRDMSRNPGIGETAKYKYKDSWRLNAVLNGTRMKVPRYYHEAWEKTATPEQLERRLDEIYELSKQQPAKNEYHNKAHEMILASKQAQSAIKRNL